MALWGQVGLCLPEWMFAIMVVMAKVRLRWIVVVSLLHSCLRQLEGARSEFFKRMQARQF